MRFQDFQVGQLTGASASGRSGILRWQWRMLNQDDIAVLDLEATSLFDLRTAGEPEPY